MDRFINQTFTHGFLRRLSEESGLTQQYEHAFLLIESIQPEDDKLEGSKIFFSNRVGEASVYLNELNFQDARELAQKCVFKTWSIKAAQEVTINYRTRATLTTTSTDKVSTQLKTEGRT